MIFATILLVALVVWGLKEGDVGPREAAIYGVVAAGLLAGSYFFAALAIPAIVAVIAVDIILVFKVFGTNPQIH